MIPRDRVLAKLDSLLRQNDYGAAKRLLQYWLDEAKSTGDGHGILLIQNELMGLCRKLGEKENAFVLDAKVELTEMLGDNTNVYVNIEDANAILKVNPYEAPEMDDDIVFSIPVESAYLFDAETEMVIDPQAAAVNA